jgi:hypothetical protein
MSLPKRCRNYAMLSFTAFTLAAITLAPIDLSSVPNFMGYISCCPRAPISTLILGGMGFVFIAMSKCIRQSFMEYKGLK